jgi:hypothetical protein
MINEILNSRAWHVLMGAIICLVVYKIICLILSKV